MMIRVIFCVLCVALWSGIACAQHVSNFDACVSEASQKHADSTLDNYSSYRCDGATAQKLAVRPDACSSDDIKPSRIERKSKQLGNGLYLRMVWRTRLCAGMCEIQIYNDSRDTSYRCEVRRHSGESREARNDDPPPRRYRRSPYPYDDPPPRQTWRPVRRYHDPEYDRRWRLDEEDARRMDRWIYRGEWHRVYPREDRDEYRDVHHEERGDYRDVHREERGDYRDVHREERGDHRDVHREERGDYRDVHREERGDYRDVHRDNRDYYRY
jgi:hypothetical protein